MKIGLYSITYLGCWYRGEALTLPELIRTAKRFGYDGVEIDGKRPHGNPLDWPTRQCKELRSMADSEGIEIHGVAANNDFSNPVPEVREAQICFVRELIRMTADLGAKHLRVFLAWWGITRHPKLATYDIAEGYWPIIHEKFSAEELWDWCRESLIECAGYAGDMGVTLALQNHKPIIKDHRDVLRMVREVNSPHLQVCLDVPLMPDKSAAAIGEAARAVGTKQVMSHFCGEFDRNANGSITGVDRIDGRAALVRTTAGRRFLRRQGRRRPHRRMHRGAHQGRRRPRRRGRPRASPAVRRAVHHLQPDPAEGRAGDARAPGGTVPVSAGRRHRRREVEDPQGARKTRRLVTL